MKEPLLTEREKGEDRDREKVSSFMIITWFWVRKLLEAEDQKEKYDPQIAFFRLSLFGNGGYSWS